MVKKKTRKAKKEVVELKDEIKEVKEEVVVEASPIPKVLSVEEILKFQLLMATVQLKEKEIQLTEKKTVSYDYEVRLLQKDRQLLDRLVETVKLKQGEVQMEVNGKKELLAKAHKEYKAHVADVSKKYDVNFYECTFDPLTGIIEKV